MKNIWKLIGALVVLVGVLSLGYSAQTCQRSDFLCFESGPSQSLITPFRVDAAGNVTILGNESVTGTTTNTGTTTALSNILLGAGGVGTANTTSAANVSLTIPVLVSTAISQGMAIIATTQNQPGFVNGVMAQATGSTAVIGIADAAAASGTVVNVDFSGLAVALTTGAVTVGDLLVSTTGATGSISSGYLATNNSASAGAIVATALQTQASTYSGLTRILIHH
jgi:hypothetical protein